MMDGVFMVFGLWFSWTGFKARLAVGFIGVAELMLLKEGDDFTTFLARLGVVGSGPHLT